VELDQLFFRDPGLIRHRNAKKAGRILRPAFFIATRSGCAGHNRRLHFLQGFLLDLAYAFR
jgi:hypothetical protein